MYRTNREEQWQTTPLLRLVDVHEHDCEQVDALMCWFSLDIPVNYVIFSVNNGQTFLIFSNMSELDISTKSITLNITWITMQTPMNCM